MRRTDGEALMSALVFAQDQEHLFGFAWIAIASP
jgi:hypothetical protein